MITKEHFALILHDHGYSDIAIESLWNDRPYGAENRSTPESIEATAIKEMKDPIKKEFFTRKNSDWLSGLTDDELERLISEFPVIDEIRLDGGENND